MDRARYRTEAIATGWASVRFILGVIFTLFGPPAEILATRLLPRAWRADLVAWLRPAEALVRRLLLIRAAELAGGLTPIVRTKSKSKPRARKPERVTPPEDAAAWKAIAFTVLLPARRRGLKAQRGAQRAVPFVAQGLAERLEALIRVVHAPDRAAVRLARRLKTNTPDTDLVGRVLRPVVDHPSNPAREAMKRLAPYTDEADRFFSSA